ncbi:MAG TPA: type III secretion system chaperone, partial [Burkholderiaceae bacterium]|nr:type III secretion system chaperone [Burkholderiaceae bacterium]
SLWEDNPGAKMAANGPEGEVIFLFDWFADNPTLADLNDLLTQFVEYADLWCQYVTSEPETTMSAPSPMMLMTMLA